MDQLVAVLDANVLFPASLRDLLLRLASADVYRLQWTETILEEVRRNLLGKGGLSESQVRHLMDEMHHAFANSFVRDYEPLIEAMTNDPKDRLFWRQQSKRKRP